MAEDAAPSRRTLPKRIPTGRPKGKPRGRPFQPGNPGGPGRAKGTPNLITAEVREFWASVLQSQAYKDRAKQRVIDGTAPGLEQLAYHYAAGNPSKETVEVGDESLAKLLAVAANRGFGKKS